MTEAVKKNIWKVYIFKFCICFHLIGGVLVPFFTDWGGITFTQIMILQAWFMFWIFILEIPTGTIADYLGRKYSLILGAGVNIVAIIIYTSIPNFFLFLLGEFAWAMSEALVSGAGEAFIYDTLKQIGESEKSKNIFGRSETFSSLGFMVSAPIGSICAQFFGLKYAMLLMAIPFTSAILIGLNFIEPQTEQKREKKPFLKIMKEGLKFVYKNKIVKILAFEMISIGILVLLLFWLYQPMLMELNVAIIFFGFIQAIWIGCGILIMNNYGRLERAFGSKRRYIIFSALIIGSMLIIGGLGVLHASIPLTILSIILITTFGFSRVPLLINYINKHIPSSERATILSTINMLNTLGMIIGYLFIGWSAEWSLSITLIILGSLAILFSIISRVKEEYLID